MKWGTLPSTRYKTIGTGKSFIYLAGQSLRPPWWWAKMQPFHTAKDFQMWKLSICFPILPTTWATFTLPKCIFFIWKGILTSPGEDIFRVKVCLKKHPGQVSLLRQISEKKRCWVPWYSAGNFWSGGVNAFFRGQCITNHQTFKAFEGLPPDVPLESCFDFLWHLTWTAIKESQGRGGGKNQHVYVYGMFTYMSRQFIVNVGNIFHTWSIWVHEPIKLFIKITVLRDTSRLFYHV